MIRKLFTGPMCAGKSEALWHEYTKTSTQSKGFYRFTTGEYGKKTMISHGGLLMECTMIHDWSEINFFLESIFIDEIQFASMDTLPVFLNATRYKDIFLAGLNTDWRGMDFEITKLLSRECLAVKILSATCSFCGSMATKSKKITANNDRIDEFAEYKPVCNVCFYQEQLQNAR